MPPENKKPKVSLIVPVYNGESCIGKLLDSILKQDYPRDRFEVFIVDNNSRDNTAMIVREYGFTLLEEKEKQSSYSCRNKGLKNSSGEVIAFTDADCVLKSNWISEGVGALEEMDADIVCGRIDFEFSNKPGAGELFDSIYYLNTKEAVSKGKGQTANLFVRAEVFSNTGYFNEVKSGGDSEWVTRAVRKGAKLVYGEKAAAVHPTRRFGELVKKSFRVGTGAVSMRMSKGFGLLHEFFYHSFYLLPVKMKIGEIIEKINDKDEDMYSNKKAGIILVGVLVKMTARFGAFWGMIKLVCRKLCGISDKKA